MEPVIFNGVRYYKSKKTGYWSHNGKHEAPATLHLAIWEHHNGPIPDGMEVHHIDEDKDHNETSNFQLLTIHDHRVLHSRRIRPQQVTCEACGWRGIIESRSNKKIIFCSQKCNFASWRAAHPTTKKLGATYHRACPHCLTEFDTIYPTKVYCKVQCHRNAAKRRSRKHAKRLTFQGNILATG